MTEIRYRRLLALYPRDFRQEYGDEMLGVLMADPRPGVVQTLDIVRGAILAHLRASVTGQSQAARIVQIFGAMLLLGFSLRRLTGVVIMMATATADGYTPHVPAADWVRPVVWGVALAGAVLGWRVLGAGAATIGLTAEILVPFQSYADTPATVLYAYWLIVAAAVVLIAGLAGDDAGVLWPRGWWLVAGAAAALAVVVARAPFAFFAFGYIGSADLLTIGVTVSLLLVALLMQGRDLRRRLLCWAAPIVVSVPLVRYGFIGFIEFNMRNPDSTRLLNPLHWAVLVIVPAAAFLGAAMLTNRTAAAR
ncbi:hypothetical protein KOI35_00100 [Actinoplanes bogorensis]|uniref:Uncharacterized protein n=1 Tax=Paractinoplanes bogorensis TaxID=1610840 RepID=A0ABS5YF32_9ACTN|nr:hypothetical protein [Actinoplanes bogorensis]MBU2661897.1 hypothetical protein [Actinoplanes bogorensis]